MKTKPPHEPTDATRQTVELHTTVGTRQDIVAQILGIDPKTLRKHYRNELDLSTAKANATIGGALFNKAKNGDTSAMIFWMKTRSGWKETSVVDNTSSDGTMTPQPNVLLTNLSDEELAQLERLTDKARDQPGMGEAD